MNDLGGLWGPGGISKFMSMRVSDLHLAWAGPQPKAVDLLVSSTWRGALLTAYLQLELQPNDNPV